VTFCVRHEGSPIWVDGQTAADLVKGLRDGRWEPTDEVRGEADADWTFFEDHPRFAETAADIKPPPRKHHPDETRLDMNPLIDVALVLLIFFILTTTYETIRKVLDMPGASQKTGRPRVVTLEEAKKATVLVTVVLANGRPVIKVEDQAVNIGDLDVALRRVVHNSKKTTLLLDAASPVDYGTVMAVVDKARAAGITRVLWADKPAEAKSAAGP
jgi:biopolymer transport protein ExbD